MIVECSNCQTRFQLDDSRVPLRGIRVRCSRCKEAFFLEHPDAGKADALNDVAAQAAAGGTAPDSTQDLPSESSLPHTHSAEPEEEDWEFNDDLPGSEDADLDDDDSSPFGRPDEEEDDEERGVFDTATTSVSLDADDDGPIPGLGVDEFGDADEGFGDDESRLNLESDDGAPSPPEISAATVSEQSDFGEASDFSALADEVSTPDPVAPPRGPSPAAGPASSEAVGEPEDWDFFSDESLERPAAMDDAMGRARQAVGGNEAPRRPASRGPDLGNVASDTGSRFAFLPVVGRAVGWLATLGLLGLGVARGVFHVADPASAVPTSVDLGQFRAKSVSGRWLETVRATHLYAVSGLLVNESGRPLLPGDGLKVALRAPDGSPLDVPPARAGLPLADQALRESSHGDLAEAADDAARDLANMRLEPGEDILFQAFFDGVPDQATGFVVEMGQTAHVPAVPAENALPDPAGALPGSPTEASPAAATVDGDAALGAFGGPAGSPALTNGSCCSPPSPGAGPSPSRPASPTASR